MVVILTVVASGVIGTASLADEQPRALAFRVAKPLTFETGDTWRQGPARYRLYGIQACLRGTPFIANDGSIADCGNMSIAMLATLFNSVDTSCQPLGGHTGQDVYVVCMANSDGKVLDIGAAMIVSGYAFAAVRSDARPVQADYLVAEATARREKAGLWAGSFTHPIGPLLRGQPPQGIAP